MQCIGIYAADHATLRLVDLLVGWLVGQRRGLVVSEPFGAEIQGGRPPPILLS